MSAAVAHRFDPDQLQDIKTRERLSSLLARFGVKVRGGWCLCPFHSEKTPSCKVDDRRGTLHCFGCGQHGDAIDVIQALKGGDFVAAVEFLGGARELSLEDRETARRQRIEEEAAEKERAQRDTSKAAEIFAAGKPIKGTHAALYLRGRGLTVSPRMWGDLRFAPALPYWGYRDARSDDIVELGAYPAMLAAIRDPVTNDLIGVHRTYLSDKEPIKLIPPGDRKRNGVKKITGTMWGGAIFLSPPAPRLIIGEGIETALSADELDVGGGKVAVAAAVNLTNLSGKATASGPHPQYPDEPQRRIPNGEPDHERPGFMPPDWAAEIIILGDGDSEPVMTQATLATAVNRLMELDRAVSVAMAPPGKDWNDVLREGDR